MQLKADLNQTFTSRDYGAMTGYGNILPSGQQCWTSEEYNKYALRTGMMGASMIAFPHEAMIQFNTLIESHHDLYNQVQRPILRDCNVYHILPSPTGWTYADWDGIQYYNENIDKGVVMLFKGKHNRAQQQDHRAQGSGCEYELHAHLHRPDGAELRQDRREIDEHRH